ncbi:MAG: hypothetical protein RL619_1337 [Bacteroidota bacterium]|jgi:hypothetical protein
MDLKVKYQLNHKQVLFLFNNVNNKKFSMQSEVYFLV